MPASIRLKMFSLIVLLFVAWEASAQTPASAKPNETPQSFAASMKVVKLVSPSVVLIKAGADGNVTAQGTGVVIREDGVILTAYHVVKNAKQIQVAMKDGETYDRVELLGADERRDVAALRIPLKGMQAITVRPVSDEQIGERVFAVSNPLGMNWTFSDGLLSGVRLADDVPGAGKGYKLLQFTAPVSPGSSGGVLVDGEGRGIGLIVGALNGQNLNFAVPLSAVAALADQASKQILTGGLALSGEVKEPTKIAERSGKAVGAAEATRAERIREARLVYIVRKTSLCKPVMLQNALMKYSAQLDEWNVKLVDNERLADIVVEIDNMTLTFYYTYSIRDARAGVVLGAGRVTAWDCNQAAPGLAKQIVNVLRTANEPPKLKKQEPK
ncbi:MAG: trypsin-like peptidase domain-containing protein [Acidobacteria bacterium]|nr:trypsin-like peptidase domain-containing protein [Acidobacteriota bacterium]